MTEQQLERRMKVTLTWLVASIIALLLIIPILGVHPLTVILTLAAVSNTLNSYLKLRRQLTIWSAFHPELDGARIASRKEMRGE